MAAGIDLVGLTKRFHHGHAAAVDNIDLSVAGGEFFSLLGPSGCGKTTTLRLVTGFEEPTAGRILLDGVDVSGVPPHKRNVNTVFRATRCSRSCRSSTTWRSGCATRGARRRS